MTVEPSPISGCPRTPALFIGPPVHAAMTTFRVLVVDDEPLAREVAVTSCAAIRRSAESRNARTA